LYAACLPRASRAFPTRRSSDLACRHLAAGGRIVQNTVKAGDPEAILARGGYLPGNGGVRVLRVRVHDYEHRRGEFLREAIAWHGDRKSTRLNSSHQIISYAVFC